MKYKLESGNNQSIEQMPETFENMSVNDSDFEVSEVSENYDNCGIDEVTEAGKVAQEVDGAEEENDEDFDDCEISESAEEWKIENEKSEEQDDFDDCIPEKECDADDSEKELSDEMNEKELEPELEVEEAPELEVEETQELELEIERREQKPETEIDKEVLKPEPEVAEKSESESGERELESEWKTEEKELEEKELESKPEMVEKELESEAEVDEEELENERERYQDNLVQKANLEKNTMKEVGANEEDISREKRRKHTFEDWINPDNYDENGHYIGEEKEWGYKPYETNTEVLHTYNDVAESKLEYTEENTEIALEKIGTKSEFREIIDKRERQSGELKKYRRKQEILAKETSEKFDVVMQAERETDTYKKVLQEYNETKDRQAEISSRLIDMEKEQEDLNKKIIELRTSQLEKGEKAIADSVNTLAISSRLQEGFEEHYYSKKTNTSELKNIWNENNHIIEELSYEKDFVQLAMEAKMSEIRDYVYANNFERYETERDLYYQKMITEYRNLDETYQQLRFNVVKLGDNNLRIAEITGTNYEPIRYQQKELIKEESDELIAEIEYSKVLKRDELELLQTGSRNIQDILDAKTGVYRDSGLSENEIATRLAADKIDLQKEFLYDAFPGQEVSLEVFNAVENGTFDKEQCFFKKYEICKQSTDLIYISAPTSEMVEEFEYESYRDFYKKLDTIDLSQDYKDILVEEFRIMDIDLKNEYNKYANQLMCLNPSYRVIGENGIPQDAAYFSSVEGGFKFNQEDDLHNPLGAGNKFFHESAHMLDWLKGQENGRGNASYESYMTEAIYEDYYDTLDRIQRDNNCDMSTAQDLLSMELMRDPVASNCVSDVFGGVSLNKVFGVWGHSIEYWRNRGRNAIGEEAFAEITADRACHNISSMEFTQKYLPKTIKAYEKALKLGGVKYDRL